jgi:hypothetical protein
MVSWIACKRDCLKEIVLKGLPSLAMDNFGKMAINNKPIKVFIIDCFII